MWPLHGHWCTACLWSNQVFQKTTLHFFKKCCTQCLPVSKASPSKADALSNFWYTIQTVVELFTLANKTVSTLKPTMPQSQTSPEMHIVFRNCTLGMTHCKCLQAYAQAGQVFQHPSPWVSLSLSWAASLSSKIGSFHSIHFAPAVFLCNLSARKHSLAPFHHLWPWELCLSASGIQITSLHFLSAPNHS